MDPTLEQLDLHLNDHDDFIFIVDSSDAEDWANDWQDSMEEVE